MLVGVPKEIKSDEYRVGLVPQTVGQLCDAGHRVLIETGAGEGSGIADEDYVTAGATIVLRADDVFTAADLIVKVKEPLRDERAKLRRGQAILTYLHLAADPDQARDLLRSGVTAIAYETVTDGAGRLPLLAPMSRVAGHMAAQVAAHFLQRPQGGRGILLGPVDGGAPAEVVVFGGGVVGSNAALMASAMGADVTVTVRTEQSAQRLHRQFDGRISVLTAPDDAFPLCEGADVVIGAALVAGGSAPKLISADAVKRMKAGCVIVDVSIDQGGCAETSHPTTHSHPTFVVEGIVHYCVANMPGAVPRTSTFALNDATRPFVLAIANKGLRAAFADDPHLRNGLNIHDGRVTHRAVADALGLAYTPVAEVLGL
jgi:alanine dehydrogenase